MMHAGCEGKGDMMAMMSKMMEGCTPEMMTVMMPHCFGMILPKISKEERGDFVLKMVGTLVEQGCAGLSTEEKNELLAKVRDAVKA